MTGWPSAASTRHGSHVVAAHVVPRTNGSMSQSGIETHRDGTSDGARSWQETDPVVTPASLASGHTHASINGCRATKRSIIVGCAGILKMNRPFESGTGRSNHKGPPTLLLPCSFLNAARYRVQASYLPTTPTYPPQLGVEHPTPDQYGVSLSTSPGKHTPRSSVPPLQVHHRVRDESRYPGQAKYGSSPAHLCRDFCRLLPGTPPGGRRPGDKLG